MSGKELMKNAAYLLTLEKTLGYMAVLSGGQSMRGAWPMPEREKTGSPKQRISPLPISP